MVSARSENNTKNLIGQSLHLFSLKSGQVKTSSTKNFDRSAFRGLGYCVSFFRVAPGVFSGAFIFFTGVLSV